MKVVYKSIKPYGFEQIILNNQENIPENCTEIKAKLDGLANITFEKVGTV
ncbi:hypothetical protein EfmGK941_03050 [Enterococcus faecium]|nr:hypothetical protein [Enterococcus faecium]BDP93300.1 hypothetical protein EfmGK941_03050 [Enterococcus faecium]